MSTSTTRPRARPSRATASAVESRPAAVIALGLALAALAVARLWAATPGSMAGWGFSLLRFAPPALGWSLWTLAVLALLPPLARPVVLGLERGRVAPQVATLALALATATAVWAWPDRLHFVGDFLLREGTAARALKPSGLFPQALPLDVFLHYGLPRGLADGFGIPTAITARALGALEAAALAVLAGSFARALRLQGAAALATAAVVVCGGFLGVYTGYDKAIAEMTLLTVATGVFALRALEDPRWLLALGAGVAVGLTLHRSALGLLPAAGLASGLALSRHPSAWRRTAVRIGIGLALAALAAMLPRIVTTMRQFDPVHFTPLEGGASGGAWGALWAGTRPLDLLNLIALVSPLALVIPLLAATLGWRTLARPPAWLLAALALPWAAMTLLIHPPQGMFRDWDNYAAAGASFAMIAAWLMAEALAAAPSWRWLALAAVLGAAAPTLQWLALNADLDRGLARVAAYLSEPPRRSDAERGRTWDFLGIRNAQLGRWDAAAEAMARAAETSPSPRVLLQWALAEQARGNSPVAREAFRKVTAINPGDARGWYGLAAESWRLGDYDECRRATQMLEQVSPGSREARQLFQSLEGVAKPNGPNSE